MVIPLKQVTGKSTSRYIHKLVAEHFLDRKEEDEHVVHKNYEKLDNHFHNLLWVTKKERIQHQNANPKFADPASRITQNKLTEDRVRIIKKKLLDPNRKTRLKIIAKQFGVSEMQLHRIRTGENWGHGKVEDE